MIMDILLLCLTSMANQDYLIAPVEIDIAHA
jgi:hypothetical protein